MCEVSAVPKIGPKIESMEFLESLGEFIKFLRIRRMTQKFKKWRNCVKFTEMNVPKLC